MVIKRKIVAAYQEELACDSCGGHMLFTGNVYTTYPAQYEYKCDNCGKTTITMGEEYPRIKYVFEGEET